MFLTIWAGDGTLEILPFSYCQSQGKVFRLGVDFVLPLSQQAKQEEPRPKSIRRGCTRRLKIDTEITQGPLAELIGLGVRMTLVTRRT